MRKISAGTRIAAFKVLVGALVLTASQAQANDPYPRDDPFSGSGETYTDEVGDSWPGPPGESGEDEAAQLSPPAPRGFDFRALERAVQAEMNLLRQSPANYADKIASRRSSYRGKIRYPAGGQAILTEEGVVALDEAVDALRNEGRLPRLAWSDALNASAGGHANDLNRNNLVGHSGSDGTQPETRVARVGKVDGWVAENIAFGPRTGEDVVIGLLVDDGVADRGHRDVLLKSDLFVAGTACGPHPTYGVVCVMNYATRITPNARQTVAVAEAPEAELEPEVAFEPAAASRGVPPVWGAPDDSEGAFDDGVSDFPAFDDALDQGHDDESDPAPDAFVCPYETAPSTSSRARAPAPTQPTYVQPQLQQLLDARYPADHPRNQPPERRQVRRPILRTEGGYRGNRGEQRGDRGRGYDVRRDYPY